MTKFPFLTKCRKILYQNVGIFELAQWLILTVVNIKLTVKNMQKLQNTIFKIIDTEDDKGLKIILFIFFLLAFLGVFSSKNKATCILLKKITIYYYTRKIFSDNNFRKKQNLKFCTDTDDFLLSVNKLDSKQKKAVIGYLNECVPELKIKKNGLLIYSELKNSLKNLSFDGKNRFQQCLANICFLMKIYNVVREYVKLMFDRNSYKPENKDVINFIDIVELIDSQEEELFVIKSKLIKYTELRNENDETIGDNIIALWKCEQFKLFIDSYIEAKSTDLVKLPMPNKYDISKLKKLYNELVKYEYFESGRESDFINAFNSGIEQNVHIVWKNKNQYEFNFFILDLYHVSYCQLDTSVKDNVSKIFFYKDGKKSLNLNNTNSEDYDTKRVNKRKKITSIIENCRNIV